MASIPTLTVVTLNLKGLGESWFDGRATTVMEGLRKHQPDLICFQESTFRHGPRNYDQANEIGKSLGLPAVAFVPYGNPIEVMSSDQGGVAIISRWPFSSVRTRKLPPGHENPADSRVALFVRVETTQGSVDVVNTHLSWKPDETSIRLVQAGLIIDELNRGNFLNSDSRTLFIGDFNAEEGEPCIQLIQQYLTDAYRQKHPEDPGYTWVRTNPLVRVAKESDRRVDYIFCSHLGKVIQTDVILNEPGTPFPSDHLGVLAKVHWNAAT